MTQLSVIIPIFNTAVHLPRCLNSIKAQTYSNFQAILVDDASTDDSLSICESFAKEDSRFIVIHNDDNKGLSQTRNNALDVVASELVTFVDSDDWIEPTMFDYLIQLFNISQADIICTDLISSKQTITNQNNIIIKQYSRKEAFQELCIDKTIHNHVCGKLYRTSLFAKIRFPKDKVFEDIFTQYKLFAKSNIIFYSSQKFYHYELQPNSITYRKNIVNEYFWSLAKIEGFKYGIKHGFFNDISNRSKRQLLRYVKRMIIIDTPESIKYAKPTILFVRTIPLFISWRSQLMVEHFIMKLSLRWYIRSVRFVNQHRVSSLRAKYYPNGTLIY